MPRDERDYASMTVDQLRSELVRVTQQLSSWSESVAMQKANVLVPFLEAYAAASDAGARSHAERMKQAEMATARDQASIIEADGKIAYFTAIRDMIVHLLDFPPFLEPADLKAG